MAWSDRFTWRLCCMRSSLQITPRTFTGLRGKIRQKCEHKMTAQCQSWRLFHGLILYIRSAEPFIFTPFYAVGRETVLFPVTSSLPIGSPYSLPVGSGLVTLSVTSGRKRVTRFYCFLTCSAVNRRRQLPENSVRQGILLILLPEGPGTTMYKILP